MLHVEISAPGLEPHRMQFHELPVNVGRSARHAAPGRPEVVNHVVLPSQSVSRRHAELHVADGMLLLTNHSRSDESTLVDGRPVPVGHRVPVRPGDEVRIGEYRLRFFPAAARPSGQAGNAARETLLQLRRRVHRLVVERMDLSALARDDLRDGQLRPRVERCLDEILHQLATDLPAGVDPRTLRKEIADEALGLGPLEDLLEDDSITEIMVVDIDTIYVERAGRLSRVPQSFSSNESLRAAIERIVTPLGRRIDESSPLVDARLPDGSRVNAIIPPLSIRGPALTIRRFGRKALGMEDLIRSGTWDERIARFLTRAVEARRNIVISGGTGSGKTTLLNILSGAISAEERIVTIEDAAELRLTQPHVVSLETRPANVEGKGEYTIRDLVKNALRMRPDRIVVGECRGGEALDMLQAMNTGHDGSLTTLHANAPSEAVSRLETLCLMAKLDLPSRAIREQIAQAIDVVVQVARLGDGSRRVTHVSEITGIDQDTGQISVQDVFTFARTGVSTDGRVVGEFRKSGYLPSFLGEFIVRGLVRDGDYL